MSIILIIAVVGILIVVLSVFFLRRMLRRNEKAIATVTTPDYTENKLTPYFVFITFTTKKGEVVTHEYYYDKKVYEWPQDFQQSNPTVTVKYELDDPSNYVVFEDALLGKYGDLIASLVIGIAFGILIASFEKEVVFLQRAKVFLIWFLGAGGVSYLFFKISPYLSFLNIFSKRDEDE